MKIFNIVLVTSAVISMHAMKQKRDIIRLPKNESKKQFLATCKSSGMVIDDQLTAKTSLNISQQQSCRCWCYLSDEQGTSLAKNSNSPLEALGCKNGIIKIYQDDPFSNKDAKIIDQLKLQGPQYQHDVQHVVFNRSGNKLAYVLANKKAYVWDFQHNTVYPLHEHTHHYKRLPLTKTDAVIAAATLGLAYCTLQSGIYPIQFLTPLIGYIGIGTIAVRRILPKLPENLHPTFVDDNTVQIQYGLTLNEWKIPTTKQD